MSSTPAFSLVDGGPLCSLMRRLHLVHPDGTCDYLRAVLLLAAVTWGPLMVAAVLYYLTTGKVLRLVEDFAVHARLLLAMPLLFKAESSLDMRTRRCTEQLICERWGDDAPALARIIAAARRLRDAGAAEALLLALAVLGSQVLMHENGWPPYPVRSPAGGVGPSLARYWYGLVSLPVFQLLLYRWLWRWAIWTQLLWRVSRLHLRPTASHPDQAGGLGFLASPSVGFSYVVAALAAVRAGTWADQVVFGGVSVLSLKAGVALLVAAMLVLAVGPLFSFAGHLWRCRFNGQLQYGSLATDYVRRFQARWIERRDGDELLGTPDLQSLADLANSYGVVARTRLLPFGVGVVAVIAAAALAPILPLVLLQLPLTELLTKLAGVVLGGLPP